ncbi:hypothetical protein AB0O91_16530 [Kitasatospora sp. NPDC089797]|uniref:hypothetical protein n=1 Tax=Kitasatospora sp. NPDC089797 TaxID=3155298 RepID=UPI0034168D50
MRNDDPGRGRDKSDDDQWDELVKTVAAEREAQLRAAEPPVKRVWPRNTALALGAAAVTLAGAKLLQPAPDPAAAPAAAPTATAVAPAAARTGPDPAAGPATGAAAAGAPAAGLAPIPLDRVFPAEVTSPEGAVYTRVASVVLPSCTEADSVAPALIAMIKAGKGCVGEQVALYKDARNNQYNLAVFTMKDPLDAIDLATRLSGDFEDFEVGAQAPPPASGLVTLPPDSGMVQEFGSGGRAMLVALGQWSDGRSTDRQQLVRLLSPLHDAVGKTIFAYESQH